MDTALENLLYLKKESLLAKVLRVLEVNPENRPIEGLEIARRILVIEIDEKWYELTGSGDCFRRLGKRIIHLLGLTDYGYENRKRLGISFGVSEMGNHPLTFYLMKESRVFGKETRKT